MKLLQATFDDVASYQICCDYLEAENRNTLRELLIAYNGKPSVLYVDLFHRNLALVKTGCAILESRTLESAEKRKNPFTEDSGLLPRAGED